MIIPAGQIMPQAWEWKFDHIGIERGLSQSSVYAITQDRSGFMWFGTQDGLNRYDGFNINVFRHNPNDSNSISDNSIWSLLNDSKGNLWIGTSRGGADRYNQNENRFYHFTNSEKDSTSISGNFVTCLFEDSRGYIWIGTRSKGLNRYNYQDKKFKRFSYNENDSSSLSSNTVWDICEDNYGSIWIATNRGLSEFSENKFRRYLPGHNILTIAADKNENIWCGTWGKGMIGFNTRNLSTYYFQNDPKNPKSIPSNFIKNIFIDSGERLWIATNDAGVCSFERESAEFIHYSEDALMTLYEDRSGILWIGTFSAGVKIFNTKKNKFLHYKDDLDDLNGNIVFTLLKDKDGELWAGTYNGLKRYDRKGKLLKTYNSESSGISSNKILSLYESYDGTIWIGTLDGLSNYNKRSNTFKTYRRLQGNSNSLSYDIVTTLCEDENKSLWIGNDRSGIDRFDIKKGRFDHFTLEGTSIGAIYKDKKGIIWVGTINGGLFSLLPGSGSFKKHSLQSTSVYSIYQNEPEYLWLGTINGLIHYEISSRRITQYNTKSGLPNNNVWGILPDNSGNLWLSTNNGISRFNLQTKKNRNYNIKDGLQSNEFNRGAYYGENDKLLFGGMNGFNEFNPEEITDNKYIPPVHITAFKVFNEKSDLPDPIPSDEKIILSYSQNFISFEFVSLDFTSPEKNQYAYILEGFEKEWHFVSANQRYASYTNLDPGEYILRVKGSNNDGVWNDKGTHVSIVITPPFWMTWWFRTSFFLFLLLTGAGIYNYRVRKLREVDKVRLRIASDLHDEVGSDLGGITLISQRLNKTKNLPEQIKNDLIEINKAAFLTSEKLRDIVWFVNPEHDMSEHLVLRMKDLAGRMLKDKIYTFSVDDNVSFHNLNLEERRQIYLIFKEIIYNVLKHSEAEKVEIKLLMMHKRLQLTVNDNGRGFPEEYLKSCPENNKGMGLKNLQRRADSIGAKLNVQSRINSGTNVTVSIRMP